MLHHIAQSGLILSQLNRQVCVWHDAPIWEQHYQDKFLVEDLRTLEREQMKDRVQSKQKWSKEEEAEGRNQLNEISQLSQQRTQRVTEYVSGAKISLTKATIAV